MNSENDPPSETDQAHLRFDDSPRRFREARGPSDFPGASGVLFEQAMAQTRMAICLADPSKPDMPLVFVNNAFVSLTGYPEAEVVGRNCRFLQGPGTDPEVVADVRRAIEKESVVVVEMLNYRKDGTAFWNALHLGPIYDESGNLVYYFGSQWDVTNVHAARADERQAKMLARELSHRMKNMFAVIAGLVTVTGRNRGIEDAAGEINDQIRALGRAFETTLDEASQGSVALKPAIVAVVSPYDPTGARISFAGDGLRIDPNVVATLGLVLHELATNAVKHGALSGQSGAVELDWTAVDAGGLRLTWTESGASAPEVAAEPGGAGLAIVETLLGTMGGRLDRAPSGDGLVATLHLPDVGVEA